MRKLLMVDDDVAVTNHLMVFLMQTELYEPTVTNDSRNVAELLENEQFDVILLDMDMPNITGMDILKHMKEHEITTPVIILTGVNDAELAVKSLKLGAYDYITKPVDNDYLLDVLDKAIQHGSLDVTINELPEELKREDLTHEEAFSNLPTNDENMIRILHQAEKMAPGDLSIFIIGDRGTGKGSLARAIHKASTRRDGPFITVDVHALDPDRFTALFFGQVRDYGNGPEESIGFLDEASGGTLFLINIEDMPLPDQRRLNQVIKTHEFYRESSTHPQTVDLRLIAASHHDLSEERYKDRFSRELLYHLMVHSIKLPSLSERVDDIPVIAEHFLRQQAVQLGRTAKTIDPEFTSLLQRYAFPGNLQELRDIVATALLNEEGDSIGIDSLSPYLREIIIKGGRHHSDFQPHKLANLIRGHCLATLAWCDDDRVEAALSLGIDTSELERIIDL
ncbi:MAG: sigma-54-dependent Fis family transcriptional regulator [bacterium]|nr:sigma-54-dependent Fis family transcriptional regulator [bacterium]